VAWLTIGLIIALQLAWTYLPFMQFIFGSEALSPDRLGVILAGSIGIFLIVETENGSCAIGAVNGLPRIPAMKSPSGSRQAEPHPLPARAPAVPAARA